jgi:adenylyl-sulfate kinase
MQKNICKNSIIWLLGPTSSGKTTIAKELLLKIREKGESAIHYDGDEIRDFFGVDFGFSAVERGKVVKTLVHLANKASEAGFFVIVSALTANNDAREFVQKNAKQLVIVYLECGIEICAERDPKGLYRQAKDGKIKTLIGYNTPYDAPQKADIILNTEMLSIDTCTKKIFELIIENDTKPK